MLSAKKRLDGDHHRGGHHQRIAAHRHQGDHIGRPVTGSQIGIHHLFGNEPGKRQNAAHRQGRQPGGNRGDRHDFGQTAQIGQIAGAGGMVDPAGDHEQRPLEQGMGKQINHRAQNCFFSPNPDQHDQKPQRSHGRIGQHQLEVVLTQGQQGTGQQSGGAKPGQQRRPQDGVAQNRVHPHQQINPGFDHGGRMKIGRHRGGRFHGVGQPEMQRYLRRFGERAAQHQNHDHRIIGAFLDDGARA